MPDLFLCVPTDTYLAAAHPKLTHLIVRHQTSDQYIFELHSGHPTGNPIYIRLGDMEDHDTSPGNVTKFDTRNFDVIDFANAGRLTNKKHNTLKSSLSETEFEDLRGFCLANFDFFKKLGEDYYGNTQTTVVVQTLPKSKKRVVTTKKNKWK